MPENMILIDHVSKQYKLGQIGETTLRDALQRVHAKVHGLEDPTKRIGHESAQKGQLFLALDDVSFSVKPGERVGIIGRNGAGKSTLLKLIARITAPSKGFIGLNGRVTSMLEVGTGFHAELTGRENIYMNGAILGMTKKEIDSKLEDIIEFSECRQFIDTPVKRYSSGMYVKLAFSVAAHLDSEIMIMDEVLAVGDMAFQKKCLEKMNEVSRVKGRTILYVSHNMNTIKELCTRCIVLDHGKKIYDGNVSNGIDTYLNNGFSSMTLSEDFQDVRRDSITGNHLRIVQTEQCNTLLPRYPYGGTMELRITAKALKQLNDISFRFEIQSEERVQIGSIFVEHVGSIDANETKDFLTFVPLRGIVPGRYRATIVCYQGNEHGMVNLDWIKEAIGFEIEDMEGKVPVSWDCVNWGRVFLNDMRKD